MDWEIGVDICMLLMQCVKQITNEKLLYVAEGTPLC